MRTLSWVARHYTQRISKLLVHMALNPADRLLVSLYL